MEEVETIDCICPSCGSKKMEQRYKNRNYSGWKVSYCDYCSGIIFLSGEELKRVQILLDEASFVPEGFHEEGIDVQDIKVYKKQTDKVCFNASIKLSFSDNYIYSYNGHRRWIGIFSVMNHDRFLNSLSLFFKNKTQCFEQLFKTMHGLIRSGSKLFVETRLPDEMIIDEHFSMSLLQINYIAETTELEADTPENDARHYLKYCEENKKEIDELRAAMALFPIKDAETYIKDYERTPEVIRDVSLALIDIKKEMDIFKPLFPQEHLLFRVKKTYDKRYFIAAKIADSAVSVSEKTDSFVLELSTDQAHEIALLLELYTPNGMEEALSVSCAEARKYLEKIDRRYHMVSYIGMKSEELWEKHKHYFSPQRRVLWSVLEERNFRKEFDEIYNAIAREGRLNTKWSNEYRLFKLLSAYIQNAVYQYRPEWLSPQSLDIYLPDDNVGIEYQGKQHFESVDFFGGDESLRNNIERDQRKRRICFNNGVRLLEWKYTFPVNNENVLQFMNDNSISYNPHGTTRSVQSTEMAPVRSEQKAKKQNQKKKTIKSYIVQYNGDGEIVRQYETLKEAAQAVGVSSTSISKVLRGERRNAGGFSWKRIDCC